MSDISEKTISLNLVGELLLVFIFVAGIIAELDTFSELTLKSLEVLDGVDRE